MTTREEVIRRISYNPYTGEFARLDRAGPCGNVMSKGYLQIAVAGKKYMAHRLAWLISYGEWPAGLIDHIDRNRLNNQLSNLRIATPAQNCINSVVKTSNTGIRCVYMRRNKDGPRYVVRLQNAYHGTFEDLKSAAMVAAKVRREAYGDFDPAIWDPQA